MDGDKNDVFSLCQWCVGEVFIPLTNIGTTLVISGWI